jgi:nucleotide-binding universal stress UspA family protein
MATSNVDIKQILVAVDFSPESGRALSYGIMLAHHLKANLFVHHSYPSEMTIDLEIPAHFQSGQARLSFISERITYFLEAFVQEQCQASEQVQQWHEGLGINYQVKQGDAVETLCERASQQAIDLIIVGTRGRGEEKKLMFGSVTYDLIRQLPAPLLTVPAQANLHLFSKIAYAHKATPEQGYTHLAIIEALAQVGKASVEAFEVLKTTKDKTALTQPPHNKWLKEAVQYLKRSEVAYYSISAESTEEGMLNFLRMQKSELLVVCRSSQSFWERLFKKSQTVKAAKLLDIPMLVLKNQ